MSINTYLINALLVLLVVRQLREHQLDLRALAAPVLAVGAAAVMFLHSVPGGGNDIALELVVVAAGAAMSAIGGLATHLRLGADGRPLGRAGALAASVWIAGVGAWMAFAFAATTAPARRSPPSASRTTHRVQRLGRRAGHDGPGRRAHPAGRGLPARPQAHRNPGRPSPPGRPGRDVRPGRRRRMTRCPRPPRPRVCLRRHRWPRRLIHATARIVTEPRRRMDAQPWPMATGGRRSTSLLRRGETFNCTAWAHGVASGSDRRTRAGSAMPMGRMTLRQRPRHPSARLQMRPGKDAAPARQGQALRHRKASGYDGDTALPDLGLPSAHSRQSARWWLPFGPPLDGCLPGCPDTGRQ